MPPPSFRRVPPVPLRTYVNGDLQVAFLGFKALVEFAKELREGVRRGRITSSVRIWIRPHVKAGGRYRMEEGTIHVDSIEPIRLADITSALARESGFRCMVTPV